MNINDVVEFVDRKNSNSMIAEWKITKFCNYDCPFCSNKLMNARESSFLSQEEVEKLSLKINEMILRSKIPVDMKFIGGEPCIYDLLPLMKNLTSEFISSFMVTSNFFRDAEYYLQLKDYCKQKSIPLKLYASYHEEAVPDYNEFFNKVRKVGFDNFMTIGVVVNNNNIDMCCELIDNIKDVPIKFRIEYDKNKTPVELKDKEKERKILDYLASNMKNNNVKFITKDGSFYKYSYSKLQSEFGSIDMHDFECECHTVQIRPEGIVREGLCNYLSKYILGNLYTDEIVIKPTKHRCEAELFCNSFPINAKRVKFD